MKKNTKYSILTFVLLVLFAIPIRSNSQDNRKENTNITSAFMTKNSVEKPTEKEKRTATSFRNNFSAHLGAFDPWAGIYYERLISPYWGVDVAVGLIGGSVGTKVYYPRLSAGHLSLYSGISEGVLLLVGPKHYIPIGLTYLGEKSFRISLDLGPQIYHDQSEENQIGLTLKLGKSF